MPLSEGLILQDKYRLERKIGSGGMGEVWLAEHQVVGRRVAVKSILPNAELDRPNVKLDRELEARFRREARAAASLNHRHICAVTDLGQTAEGLLFMVMDYLEGRSLRADIRIHRDRGPGYQVGRALLLIDQLLSALGAAHARGIVHRDIKPENLFLESPDALRDLNLRLLDFGISLIQPATSRLTRTGATPGTPFYMAPEQLQFPLDADHRVDLWAVGVVLYELVAGRTPFVAEYSIYELPGKILTQPVRPPRQLRPELAPALEAVMLRALAKPPDQRYQDAGAFRDALAAVQDQAVHQPTVRRWPTAGPSVPASTGPAASVTAGRSGEGSRVASSAPVMPVAPGAPVAPVAPVAPGMEQTEQATPLADTVAQEPRMEPALGEPFETSGEPEVATTPAATVSNVQGELTTSRVTSPRARFPRLPLLAGLAALILVGAGVGIYLGTRPSSGGGSSNGKRSRAASGKRAGAERAAVDGGAPSGRAASPGPGPGKWVTISAGSFVMGSPVTEKGRFKDEQQHRVKLTRKLRIQTTEVTQAQFRMVMGYNLSHFSTCGGNCPVEQVSWHEAAAYCNGLSRLRRLPRCYRCRGKGKKVTCKPSGSNPYVCKGYRLPTEAEWEHAARAGTTGARYGPLSNVAWYNGNSGGKTHPVGTKQANKWGLYDMLGNVFEWCHDWYHMQYRSGTVTNPLGPSKGSYRVFRGGSFDGDARGCRSAYRRGWRPGYRARFLGFRPARSIP